MNHIFIPVTEEDTRISVRDALLPVLRAHAARYPGMQPADAVKLIYQNEFGGGHLISDEGACLQYLRQEYDAVPKQPDAQLWEPIGNGILRVNLAAVAESDLESLGQCFLRSAAACKGSLEQFLTKLEVLKELSREGVFCFGSGELEAYLQTYEQQGYPPVSHSPEYRRLYAPAYRVVLEAELRLLF